MERIFRINLFILSAVAVILFSGCQSHKMQGQELSGEVEESKPVKTAAASGEQAAVIKTTNLSESDFDKMLKDNPVMLVDFSATWCGPCRRLAPILEEIKTEQTGKMTVVTIDVDQNRELSYKKHIENLPTLQLFRNSKLEWTLEGFADKKMIMDEVTAILSKPGPAGK